MKSSYLVMEGQLFSEGYLPPDTQKRLAQEVLFQNAVQTYLGRYQLQYIRHERGLGKDAGVISSHRK